MSDEIANRRREKRLDELAESDSFEASPDEALDIAARGIEETGATCVLVIWEKEAGGVVTAHSRCTVATAVYLCERAKLNLLEG